jgi:hypothetical protein
VFDQVMLNTNPTGDVGGYVTGRYYSPMCDLSSTSALALTANVLYVVPFPLTRVVTWTKIGCHVSVLGAGNARLGIYAFQAGVPASLILDAGTIDVSTTGDKEVSISIAPAAQPVALVIVSSVNITVYGKSLNAIQTATGTGAIGAADYQMYRSFTYGALPGSFGAVSYQSGEVPNIWMRR